MVVCADKTVKKVNID